MTMQKIRETTAPVKFVTFDHAKRFSYQWPGQDRRECGGAELTEILRGANHEMLDIREIGDVTIDLGSEHHDE